MQRQLISLYERHFPGFLRRRMPPSLKASLTGALYRATRHPDLGFRHLRQLRVLGQEGRGVALYGAPGTGAEGLVDPLFDADLTSLGKTQIHAEFGYRGLWLGGPVRGAKEVEIRLDAVVLRRQNLRGTSRLRYILGRDSLALFPPVGRLEVVSDHGTVLGAWQVTVPEGQGGIAAAIAQRGLLEKKGGLRLNAGELAARQDAYLALYARVRAAFRAEFNTPVFILYGTLLGQHRSGDFIPGDDDFDVGYLSEKKSFTAVRDEAVMMIERLVARGFTVALNAEGKPFRICDEAAGPDIWLDNRPVFCPGDGHVWLHKQARLRLSLDDFRSPEPGLLRGVEVLKPRASEAFLAAYYGPGWHVPDPSFSNNNNNIDYKVTRGLALVNLTHAQQRDLAARIKARDLPGRFAPLALQNLYPLPEQD